MAFVHKAERKLVLYQNHNNVGPGSYIGLNVYKKKPGKVPFCTSSEKSVSRPEVLSTPGPGSYIHQTPKPRATNNIVQSSSFASQIDRFKFKTCQNPGPGSYNTQAWPLTKQSCKSESPVSWIRQPSAPSIPREGYCYSDDEDGELVMKKVSQDTETLVGPGYYDPKTLNKPRLYIWGRPQTSRTMTAGKSYSPGPGAYNSKPSEPRYKSKETASFLSKSKRDGYLPEFISEKDVPGPGRYTVASSWNNQGNRVQNFGSRCERFRAQTPDPQPGPGSYSPLESGKGGVERKVPFDSTGPRFVEFVDAVPGPGSYDTLASGRSTANRGGFGAGQDRFNYYAEHKESPGPGSYELLNIRTNSQRMKGSSVFVSKSKRMNNALQNFTPAPGTYEVVKKMGEVKTLGSVVHPILVREGSSKAKAFNIQSDRFDEKNRSYTPGPGSYKLATNSKNKGFLVAKNPRFKENCSESPGPGSYSDMKGWNKKTFNALFDLK